MNKHIIYKLLLILLPASVFFSYYPFISLGSNTSMNFELSLPLIILVLFDITALINFIILAIRQKNSLGSPSASARARARTSASARASARTSASARASAGARASAKTNPKIQKLAAKEARQKSRDLLSLAGPGFPGISDRRFFLFTIFPLFATISCLWSANPLRGLLTAGIIWALFFAVFSIIYLTPLLWDGSKRIILQVFLATAAAVCLFCFAQSILDISGVSRDTTLLCAGCTYQSFGFPHPSGFAIEPQFMGGLLLVPALLTLYLIVFKKDHRPIIYILAFLYVITLFFTFSRGAIYAFAVALVVLLVFAIRRRKFRSELISIPIASFFAALCLQGIFAAAAPTSITFPEAMASSLNQLSLGVIDIHIAHSTDSDIDDKSDVLVSRPYFDGYVAESTNTRVGLSRLALSAWSSNLRYLLFGAGLGGAGQAMYDYAVASDAEPFTIGSPKEIVQNEPISILLELGLVGTILAIFGLVLAFYPSLFPSRFLDGRSARSDEIIEGNPFWAHPALPLLLATVVAYAITLQFFSCLPNALHVYLLPPILYLVLQEESNAANSRKVSSKSTKSLPKNS